jgi:hypothetical protein
VTIERGEAWGEPGALPAGGVVVHSDAEARAVVERARRAGEPVPPLGLEGGDLWRTVGGPSVPGRLHTDAAMRLPVDIGSVLLDGRQHWFTSHLVLRRSWWHGRVVAVMNAQFLGRWDVAPRSHPGDGRFDLLDADLGLGDRWKARSRLPQGLHVPHPDIAERRIAAEQLRLDPPLNAWLDGVALGPVRDVVVRVEPDAVVVVV